MYAPVIWCFGGHFMNRDRTRMTMAKDPYAVQGLQAYADLRWKHHCTPTPADNALSPFTFESGKIAMNWGWAGESPRYRANITDFDWDIAPTPFGPRDSVTVVKGNQLVIYSETRHPQESWEFVKFMTGRYAELLLDGKMRRCVPTRYSVQRDPRYLQATEPPYHTDVFLDCVRMGRTLPIDNRYMEWSQEYIAATDPLFNLGNCTALQTAQEAERRVNRVLSSEGGF
jgi:multiple sugar transport system substrate-binding protein